VLAKALAPLGIQAIVSSDLLRTRQTAEIIRELIPAPIHFDPRLRECSFGRAEGMLEHEIIAELGYAGSAYWSDRAAHYDFRQFGGEDRPRVLARHRAALADIPSLLPDARIVLIVGHGQGLNTLLAGLGHEPSLERGAYVVIRL
jgi:probable phosphoglycerate mutase